MTQPDNSSSAASRSDFNRPGAMDLSGLKQGGRSAGGQGAAAAGSGAGGAYVANVLDVQELQGIMHGSMKYPVVVEFHSAQAQGGGQLSNALIELANEAAGKWLLVRVDADQSADIAQAMQVQAIPTVVGIVSGQLVPLFQGVQPKEAVSQVIDQLLQAAVANGVVGTAEPVAAAGDDAEEGQEAEADPRYAEADAAMERGDFAAAVAEFDKLLAETPNDAEASAGRAQASLLQRTMGTGDASTDAAEGSIEAEFAAADSDLVAGDAAAAFDRLIAVVRRTSGEDRDRARVRLLELFETRGNTDPAVVKARRELTSALF